MVILLSFTHFINFYLQMYWSEYNVNIIGKFNLKKVNEGIQEIVKMPLAEFTYPEKQAPDHYPGGLDGFNIAGLESLPKILAYGSRPNPNYGQTQKPVFENFSNELMRNLSFVES